MRQSVTLQEMRKRDAAGELIADACEAFLAGRYVDHLHAQGQRVPRWAWVNEAAHADIHVLRYVATRHRVTPGPLSWEDARAVIAAAVVAMVDSGHDLRDLQHGLLLPLEFEMMSRLFSPRGVVDRVYEGL